jgi:hypothetical protein
MSLILCACAQKQLIMINMAKVNTFIAEFYSLVAEVHLQSFVNVQPDAPPLNAEMLIS